MSSTALLSDLDTLFNVTTHTLFQHAAFRVNMRKIVPMTEIYKVWFQNGFQRDLQ